MFLKVDVDECSQLSQQHGVSSMPTFSFFKLGSKIAGFSGADESQLVDLIEKHTTEPLPQYAHFPLPFESMFAFKDIKYDLLLKNLVKFNGEMVTDVGAALGASPLSDAELKELTSLCALLEDKAFYHQNAVSGAQYAALCKTLEWPIKFALPALNVRVYFIVCRVF